jgi:hypothetical protein
MIDGGFGTKRERGEEQKMEVGSETGKSSFFPLGPSSLPSIRCVLE